MKGLLLIFNLFFVQFFFAQSTNADARQLLDSFLAIDNAASNSSGDKLNIANSTFTKNLLNFTSNPNYKDFDYKALQENYLTIAKSEDGNLTLFSWDTQTGGSMRVFEVLAQYKVGQKLYSKVINFNSDQSFDPKCFYYKIDDVKIHGKTYYLARRKSILSSALTYHSIQAYSIDGEKLNQSAKIIKTKSGMNSSLGYEVDFSAGANRAKDFPNLDIQYSQKDKVISFPLIRENDGITDRKIQYKFTGKFFEKL